MLNTDEFNINLINMSMLEMPEIWVFLIAIIAAFILYKILKTVRRMLINTIVGIVILVIGNLVFDLEIAYGWIVILTCALSGAFGAIVIILLKSLGIAF